VSTNSMCAFKTGLNLHIDVGIGTGVREEIGLIRKSALETNFYNDIYSLLILLCVCVSPQSLLGKHVPGPFMNISTCTLLNL
jgi:hypothetical protein